MSAWGIAGIVVAGYAVILTVLLRVFGFLRRFDDRLADLDFDDHTDEALRVANQLPVTPHVAMEWTALDTRQLERWKREHQ